jgi:hypothetical protein
MTDGGSDTDQDSIGWFAPPDLDLLFKELIGSASIGSQRNAAAV